MILARQEFTHDTELKHHQAFATTSGIDVATGSNVCFLELSSNWLGLGPHLHLLLELACYAFSCSEGFQNFIFAAADVWRTRRPVRLASMARFRALTEIRPVEVPG